MTWFIVLLTACVVMQVTNSEHGAIYFSALALGYLALAFTVVPEMLRLIDNARQRRRRRRLG